MWEYHNNKMKNLRKSSWLISSSINETDIEKNGNKSLLLTLFDNEPGYYHQIVRPLLISNNITELIYWLKNTQLIKSEQICLKKMASGICESPMIWIEAKGPDLYKWKCKTCSKKKSIRSDSIFSDLKCDLKEAIRIILAWCKGYHVDYVANMIGTNNKVIEELYIRAASVAEKCMRSNIKNWQVGGPGVVVVVDTYPEGCTNTSLTRMSRPILCISEIKTIPQKYWLEALDRYTTYDTQHINSLKQKILRTVQTVVRPGSILITPATSTLCSYDDFQHLRSLYPTIVSIRDLARHNNDRQNVFANLETIWRRILDICEEAQFYCSSYIDLFVMSHMWRTVYGNEAFEVLLYQISAMQ